MKDGLKQAGIMAAVACAAGGAGGSLIAAIPALAAVELKDQLGFYAAVFAGMTTLLAGWLAWNGVQQQIKQVERFKLEDSRRLRGIAINYANASEIIARKSLAKISVTELSYNSAVDLFDYISDASIIEREGPQLRDIESIIADLPIDMTIAMREILRLEDDLIYKLKVFRRFIKVEDLRAAEYTARQLETACGSLRSMSWQAAQF